MNLSIARRILDASCGRGGVHCFCCRPPRRFRRAHARIVRRRVAREAARFETRANGETA